MANSTINVEYWFTLMCEATKCLRWLTTDCKARYESLSKNTENIGGFNYSPELNHALHVLSLLENEVVIH